MRQALPQGIRNIKTFTKYKNCCCWGLTNLSSQKKNTRSSHSCYGWKWHLTLWQNILNFVKIKKFWKLVICFCYFWKKKKFVRRGPWGPIFLLRLDWKIVIFWGFSKMFFRSTGFELTLLILIEFPNTFHWKQAKNQSWCGLGSKFGPK